MGSPSSRDGSPTSPHHTPTPHHEITCSEWAISRILSFTDPRTVCRLASVSQTFLAASKSDVVWARFLSHLSCPRHLESEDGSSLQNCSKRELFFRLARSISFRDGTQRYWLDRATGAECYMLSARALQITWGSSPQYWKWLPRKGAWFPEVAYLAAVCWFEIRGTFSEILRPGKYTLSFRMQMATDTERMEGEAQRPMRGLRLRGPRMPMVRRGPTGWETAPVKVSVQTSEGEEVVSDWKLLEEGRFERSEKPVFEDEEEEEGDVEWVELDAGEFNVEGDKNKDNGRKVEITFAMLEIEQGAWKRGLFLDGVMLRPSSSLGRATLDMQHLATTVLLPPSLDSHDQMEEEL